MSSSSPEDRRSTLNTSLAVRVAIAGSVVLALFAIVFFRLWFLQVLTGDHYVLTASRNQTRAVLVNAPRGEILASDGAPLVTSTTALAVQIVPSELPVKVNQSNLLTRFAADERVYARLAHLVGESTKPRPCKVATPPPSCQVATGRCPHSTTRRLSPIACTVAQSIALSTYSDVTIKQPVSSDVQFYIAERASSYPGVQVVQTTVPGYPFGGLAAQTLGYVGRLNTGEQKLAQFKGVNPSSVVGQLGLEYQYDQYLRGRPGKQNIEVNAQGIAVGQGVTRRPIAGDNLKTSLDLKVQQVGDTSMQKAIDQNNGTGGAFVAMNPDTGAIEAIGSLPTYNPSIFTQPYIPTAQYNAEFGPQTNDPQDNRATQLAAPNGSTFKVITSTAALQSGLWQPDQTYDDTGQFCPAGNGIPPCFHNAEHTVGGPIDMVTALKISDDVFYYHLGDLLNVDVPQGGALQKWAKLFGVGEDPHVDIPGASSGLLPSPAFYDLRAKQETECENATGDFRYANAAGDHSARKLPGYHRAPKHPYDAITGSGGCGLATGDGSWSVGDNINAAVGQGDDEISPLQLAMVYSAIENGGTIPRPHVGQDIESADGTVLQKLTFPALRHLDIDPTNLQTIQTGLHEAAQGGGAGSNGTSQTVFQNFGLPVYGKTGTAQYIPTSGPSKGQETDTAWYACYSTGGNGKPPMVVTVWTGGGGFGALAAAPVARQILSQYYFGKPGPFVSGTLADQ